MATDQQFESTIERIVATLRAELAAAFQKHAGEVAERSAAERDTAMRQAAEAVRQETQDQIQQVRRAAQEQIDAARRAPRPKQPPAPEPKRRSKTFAASAEARSKKSNG